METTNNFGKFWDGPDLNTVSSQRRALIISGVFLLMYFISIFYCIFGLAYRNDVRTVFICTYGAIALYQIVKAAIPLLKVYQGFRDGHFDKDQYTEARAFLIFAIFNILFWIYLIGTHDYMVENKIPGLMDVDGQIEYEKTRRSVK